MDFLSYVLSGGNSEVRMGDGMRGWIVLMDDLVGNIVVIGALAALFVGYTVYANRQGRPVTVGNKKVN